MVSSGSTDKTVEIAQSFPKVKLMLQEKREGKTSAINLALKDIESDIIVLQSADTIPGVMCYQNLLKPFADPQIGMTGVQPIPVNTHGLAGQMGQLLWRAHHQAALRSPKLGECVAFRRVFQRLEKRGASVDEASIERQIVEAGYTLKYCPDAIVFNQPPKTLRDLWKQRKRIARGHRALRGLGYTVATDSLFRSFQATWQASRKTPYGLTVLISLALMELAARLQAFKSEEVIWQTAESTKSLHPSSS